jgi:RHS repeat-associated protein
MKKIILIISFIVLGLFNQHALANVVYVHNDALGSPIMESDASGAIIPGSHSHYKPFGETLEPMKEGVGYTGHLNDTDLGLTYMQARYYDPVIGRFYSNDPVGYTAKNPVMSFNRYMYVNNNPYKYNDPDGKLLNFVIGAAVGAAIEAGIQLATTGTIDGDSVMAAAAVGAVTGGVGGLLAKGAARGAISAGEAIAATASTGGIANGIATATTNPNATAGEIATSMVLGAAGAGAGAKIANKAVSKLESMSKAGGIPGHIASTTRTGGDVAGKTSAGAELGKVAADTISNAGTKAASCSSTNSSC